MGEGGGEFARVQPLLPMDPSVGRWGAWEMVLRYSSLDLTDQVVYGGELTDWTAGCNWYPAAFLRWSFNYIHAAVEDRNSVQAGTPVEIGPRQSAHILLTRFQVEF
jgi:phosphate-selective porin